MSLEAISIQVAEIYQRWLHLSPRSSMDESEESECAASNLLHVAPLFAPPRKSSSSILMKKRTRLLTRILLSLNILRQPHPTHATELLILVACDDDNDATENEKRNSFFHSTQNGEDHHSETITSYSSSAAESLAFLQGVNSAVADFRFNLATQVVIAQTFLSDVVSAMQQELMAMEREGAPNKQHTAGASFSDFSARIVHQTAQRRMMNQRQQSSSSSSSIAEVFSLLKRHQARAALDQQQQQQEDDDRSPAVLSPLTRFESTESRLEELARGGKVPMTNNHAAMLRRYGGEASSSRAVSPTSEHPPTTFKSTTTAAKKPHVQIQGKRNKNLFKGCDFVIDAQCNDETRWMVQCAVVEMGGGRIVVVSADQPLQLQQQQQIESSTSSTTNHLYHVIPHAKQRRFERSEQLNELNLNNAIHRRVHQLSVTATAVLVGGDQGQEKKEQKRKVMVVTTDWVLLCVKHSIRFPLALSFHFTVPLFPVSVSFLYDLLSTPRFATSVSFKNQNGVDDDNQALPKRSRGMIPLRTRNTNTTHHHDVLPSSTPTRSTLDGRKRSRSGAPLPIPTAAMPSSGTRGKLKKGDTGGLLVSTHQEQIRSALDQQPPTNFAHKHRRVKPGKAGVHVVFAFSDDYWREALGRTTNDGAIASSTTVDDILEQLATVVRTLGGTVVSTASLQSMVEEHSTIPTAESKKKRLFGEQLTHLITEQAAVDAVPIALFMERMKRCANSDTPTQDELPPTQLISQEGGVKENNAAQQNVVTTPAAAARSRNFLDVSLTPLDTTQKSPRIAPAEDDDDDDERDLLGTPGTPGLPGLSRHEDEKQPKAVLFPPPSVLELGLLSAIMEPTQRKNGTGEEEDEDAIPLAHRSDTQDIMHHRELVHVVNLNWLEASARRGYFLKEDPRLHDLTSSLRARLEAEFPEEVNSSSMGRKTCAGPVGNTDETPLRHSALNLEADPDAILVARPNEANAALTTTTATGRPSFYSFLRTQNYSDDTIALKVQRSLDSIRAVDKAVASAAFPSCVATTATSHRNLPPRIDSSHPTPLLFGPTERMGSPNRQHEALALLSPLGAADAPSSPLSSFPSAPTHGANNNNNNNSDHLHHVTSPVSSRAIQQANAAAMSAATAASFLETLTNRHRTSNTSGGGSGVPPL